MPTQDQCPLWLDEKQHETSAQQLSADFHLPLVHTQPKEGLYLAFDRIGLALCKVGSNAKVQVDFTSGGTQHRRIYGGGEMITKAVNNKQNQYVWDFTAGLGRDAFVLANTGMIVHAFERHKVVAALLSDGLKRAQQHNDTAAIIANIQLHPIDVITQKDYLTGFDQKPDVVYLDPMYPQAQKKAAVKKEMAFFHELVGLSDEGQQLMDIALTHAKKRVVVKRPRLGETLTKTPPNYCYAGKSTRFDVYLPTQNQVDRKK
ncbi:class I SAM-dependent methyltransferase [Neisseria sp. Ec49-e6-T10]|uniref:class I SAM-dependent methyltransferase n=1 Tax=Neisseria sp. Ec49-e6-T10 TaxID=3140744 RepID=UPI003EB8B914